MVQRKGKPAARARRLTSATFVSAISCVYTPHWPMPC